MKCLLPAPPWPLRQKILIWSTKFDFSIWRQRSVKFKD
jgi:hypothetical protein